MSFNLPVPELELLIKFVTLIGALAGGFFALYQWKHAVKIKRAEFISQIIEKLRFNEELSNMMNMIDYGEDWYDENFHNNRNGFELKIDRLFSYINYVLILRKNSIITEIEFECLQYKFNRICSFHNTQAYLWNIHHFSAANKSLCSFFEMVEYAKENGFLPAEFWQHNSTYYKKWLNF